MGFGIVSPPLAFVLLFFQWRSFEIVQPGTKVGQEQNRKFIRVSTRSGGTLLR